MLNTFSKVKNSQKFYEIEFEMRSDFTLECLKCLQF